MHKSMVMNMMSKVFSSLKGDNKGVVIPHRFDGNKNIICFVHGFCGNAKSTFMPMPEFIINEKEFDGWDVISVGYSTDIMPNIGKGVWASSPDINKIAGYLQTNIEDLSIHYSRVALIGHSMGGLVIQRTILNMQDISKISHVLFYGTPSAGLRKAGLVKWFKNQINDMNNDSKFIKKLRNEWNRKFIEEYPFRFATIAGELDQFVPINSSLEPFPEKYRSFTSGNHITMVKPETENDTSFLILRNIFHSKKDFLKGFDLRELNNLVGQYHEDANTLEQRLHELDSRGFKRYIFALEGTGKIDIAIKAIENSELLKTNSDMMGILGGRFKRKYLIENESSFLESAISWYKEALKISSDNKISNQIYYHAINLAFLYLMQKEHDLTECKQMARLALDHCEKCSDGNYWEIATKAEAYLYLNDFGKSKRLYSEAKRMCKSDIRSMSSIMINAIYACNSLNKLHWKSELEEIFM